MENKNVKFTIEGYAVVVLREIEGGHLVRHVYSENPWDEEDRDYPDEVFETDALEIDFGKEAQGPDIMFYETLFDRPPTKKYHEAVEALLKAKREIEQEISDLRHTKRNEESLLGKINNFPVLKALADYLTGDYEWVLFLDTLEPRTKSQVLGKKYVRTANIRGGQEFHIFLCDDKRSWSTKDDPRIATFKTKEDLDVFSKNLLIEQIKNWSVGQYINPDEAFFIDNKKNIHKDCVALQDPEVMEIYQAKYSELRELSDQKKQADIDKRLEELEDKKKELLEKRGK